MLLIRLGFQSICVLLGISFVAFCLITLMPSDPVHIALHLWNLPADDETILMLQAEWGLDQPLLARYFYWLIHFAQGDWGRSFRTGELVLAEFSQRLPLSLFLGFSGLVLAFLLAIPFGFLAALTPGGIVDKLLSIISVLVQTIPNFLLGLLLLWGLGVKLRWLRPFADDASAVILPILIIALHSLAIFARIYHHDMMTTVAKPYFRTAVAKGLSRRQALFYHAHPSALYALLAAMRAQAGWAIGSTATMEILFNLPGISQFLVQSIGARDQMVLQAYVMVIALWMLTVNICTHLGMVALEPKLKTV